MQQNEPQKQITNFTSFQRMTFLFLVIIGIVFSIGLFVVSGLQKNASSNSQSQGSVLSSTSSSANSNEVIGTYLTQDTPIYSFDVLAKNGIKFAYIRSTTGTTSFDDQFNNNMQQTNQAGIKRGVYLVFNPSSTAKSMLYYFNSSVNKQYGELPIGIQVSADSISDDSSKTTLNSLISLIQKTYNKDVVIFGSADVENALGSNISGAKYWITQNSKTPNSTNDLFIQYSAGQAFGTGIKTITVPAILFNGDTNAWNQLISKNSQ